MVLECEDCHGLCLKLMEVASQTTVCACILVVVSMNF